MASLCAAERGKRGFGSVSGSWVRVRSRLKLAACCREPRSGLAGIVESV